MTHPWMEVSSLELTSAPMWQEIARFKTSWTRETEQTSTDHHLLLARKAMTTRKRGFHLLKM